MTQTPHYPLDKIKTLLQDPETRIITRRDRAEAASLGYADDEEMVARILRLSPHEFYKTMPSTDKPGLWQDVYKTEEGNGTGLYIKLQIAKSTGVVISFKAR